MTTPNQKLIDDQLSKQIVDEMLAMPTEELKEMVRKRMGKINLSELEAKAKAATFVDMRDGMRAYTAMEFNEAMNPTTALALIRVARAALNYVNEPTFNGDKPDFRIKDKMLDELHTALKEIE